MNIDWEHAARVVQEHHAATGQWLPYEHILELRIVEQMHDDVSWDVKAAAVTEHFRATGVWASYEDIAARPPTAPGGPGAGEAEPVQGPPGEAPATAEFGSVPVFFDGFDGTSVDRSKWPITYGGSTYENGAFQWSNGELSVSDGSLRIGLHKGSGDLWDVGGLSSTPTWWGPGFSTTYGRVEMRARVSEEVTGAGPVFLLWPASNDHWPPEVDILETPSGDAMFTNHYVDARGQPAYDSFVFDLDVSEWHTYALEWTPERLTLEVDGREIHTFRDHVPSEPMALGFQGHVGSDADAWYGGSPNRSGVTGVDIEVDWVAAYDYVLR